MIYAQLDENMITIWGDIPENAQQIMQIPGAFRTRGMPPKTYKLPFSVEAVRQLKERHVMCKSSLVEAAKRTLAAQQYVANAKANSTPPSPICRMPLKAGIKPYQHQVVGFNVALALFGYDISQSNTERRDSE